MAKKISTEEYNDIKKSATKPFVLEFGADW
ncbi:hypothetical protein JOC48_004190 [Aquibacillus albus]|uniref:DUF255 domain-containing protein n=1 Tax=Aquibacillus albus TaxID=1168171 RepID=A0ABS2N6E7_9BACI|nr:hypothetical protein [Aquibacillus albus]